MIQTTTAATRRRQILTLLTAAVLSAGSAAACEHCGSACPSCQDVYSQPSGSACDCQSCPQRQSSNEPRRGVMLGLGSKLLDSVDRSTDAFERSVHSLLELRPKLKQRSSGHRRVDPCDLPSYAAILEMPLAGQLIDEPFQHEFHCIDELNAEVFDGEELEAEAWDEQQGNSEATQPIESVPAESDTNPFSDDPVHDDPVRTSTAPVSTRVRAAAPTDRVPTLHVPAVRPQTDYFHDPFGDEAEHPADKSVPAGNRYKSAAAATALPAVSVAKAPSAEAVELRLRESRPTAQPVNTPVSNPVYSRAYDPQAYIEEQRRYDKIQDAVSKTLTKRRTLSNVASAASDIAQTDEQVAPASYVGKPAVRDPLVRPAAALQLGR